MIDVQLCLVLHVRRRVFSVWPCKIKIKNIYFGLLAARIGGKKKTRGYYNGKLVFTELAKTHKIAKCMGVGIWMYDSGL